MINMPFSHHLKVLHECLSRPKASYAFCNAPFLCFELSTKTAAQNINSFCSTAVSTSLATSANWCPTSPTKLRQTSHGNIV